MEKNTELIFLDKTIGTNVPKQFVPGVERGFKTMCEKGYLSGHKIAGVKFTLFDGMHHIVDSSELAFFLAAEGAMKESFLNGSWQILEPIMSVEITTPIEFQVSKNIFFYYLIINYILYYFKLIYIIILKGIVNAQITRRHGIIINTENNEGWCTLKAEVPLNEMFGYIGELRSTTQGKGEFTMEYARYTPCLPEVEERLIREYQESNNLLSQQKKN